VFEFYATADRKQVDNSLGVVDRHFERHLRYRFVDVRKKIRDSVQDMLPVVFQLRVYVDVERGALRSFLARTDGLGLGHGAPEIFVCSLQMSAIG